MASKDLALCVPKLREFVPKFISLAKSKLGLNVIVTCTARDIFEQTALYAQGRKSLGEVNKLRKIVNLPPISASDNKRQVTWTMKSRHIIDRHNSIDVDDFSYAVDVAILKENSKNIEWNIKADVNKDNESDYVQLVKLAHEIDPDIECGGDWKTPDYPHYQVRKKIA